MDVGVLSTLYSKGLKEALTNETSSVSFNVLDHLCYGFLMFRCVLKKRFYEMNNSSLCYLSIRDLCISSFSTACHISFKSFLIKWNLWKKVKQKQEQKTLLFDRFIGKTKHVLKVCSLNHSQNLLANRTYVCNLE